MSDSTYDQIMRDAASLGRDAGKCLASWAFDGNTSEETYQLIKKGLDNGDPAIIDRFRSPDLSGEYSGDPSPGWLAQELGINDDDFHILDDACDAWQIAADEAFWAEIERVVHYHTEGE
jgi:hypothetical protein